MVTPFYALQAGTPEPALNLPREGRPQRAACSRLTTPLDTLSLLEIKPDLFRLCCFKP
jgi:hypothetical protein